MIRLFQSSWVIALTGCLLYLGVTQASWIDNGVFASLAPLVDSAQANLEKSSDNDPSWRFHNPEFDQWVSEMKSEKEALDLREQQLKELELRLDAERQELTTVTQTVYQFQTEFDKNVIRIKDQEVENLKRQARVLSAMSPDAAANLINEMSETEAVRILFTMKTDEASAVLETLSKLGRTEAKRAATITERIRRTLPPEPKTR